MSSDVRDLVKYLKDNNYTISFAESMTVGAIVSQLGNISGVSQILGESYITYSNLSKIKILKVKQTTISNYQVVSKEVCMEMLAGLINLTKTDFGVVITGNANIEKNSINKLESFIGINVLGKAYFYHLKFEENNRILNIKNAVQFTYQQLKNLIKK